MARHGENPWWWGWRLPLAVLLLAAVCLAALLIPGRSPRTSLSFAQDVPDRPLDIIGTLAGTGAVRASQGAREPSPHRHHRAPVTTTYTVVPGDDLWDISRRFCPSGNDWVNLWKANETVIGADPQMIYSGEKLAVRCS